MKNNMKLLRKKSIFKSEADAFKSVLEKNPELTPDQLQAAHTEKCWNWKQKANENLQNFTVEKRKDYLLGEATALAMAHLDTFEANIKIIEEDDDKIIFSKVRG